MRTMLDSQTLQERDRYEAFRSALDDVLMRPTRVERCHRAQGTFWQRQLGLGVLQGFDMTGELTLSNRPRPGFDDSSPERVSVAVVLEGDCSTISIKHRETRNDRVRLTDLSSEYEVEHLGPGRTVSFEIDRALIGVSMDTLRMSVNDGANSPLHAVLRRHLVDVASTAGELPPEALSALGLSTANLVRGMILSASRREADRREAMAESLTVRIHDYVNRHLGDPELTPITLAAAHNISLRYLYQLLSHLDQTPSDWIFSRRIAAAKEDLAYRQDSVTVTAQRWGFKDPSHFTRRFKAAYGTTPHEYRQIVRSPHRSDEQAPRQGN